MTPWPGAFTHTGGKVLKVLATRRSEFATGGAPPGTVVLADVHTTLVACLDGTIDIPALNSRGANRSARASWW